MRLTDDTLEISRDCSDLDMDVIEFTRLLDDCTVDYVISGYVAILTGRSRATEDIDIVLEPLNKNETEQLVTELKSANELAQREETDPVEFITRRDSHVRSSREENEDSG